MSIWGNIWDKVTDFAHNVTGIQTEDQKRNAQKMINDQVKAYKEQSEITKNELSRVKNEEATEKRRINEKQIRALRRNYRSAGLLGQGQPGATDMNSKLGG